MTALSGAVDRFRALHEGVAETILKQLKAGMGKLDYMAMGIKPKTIFSFKADTKFTGAESTSGPGVQFDVRGHWKGRVLIRLHASDTYTIIFGRNRRRKNKKFGFMESYWKVDKQLAGIYVDVLGKTVRDNVLGNGIKK